MSDDDAPRPPDRRLPVVGAVLALGAAAACVPKIYLSTLPGESGPRYSNLPFHFLCATLLAVLGVFTAIAGREPRLAVQPAKNMLRLGIVAMLAFVLHMYLPGLIQSLEGRYGTYLLFGLPASLALSLGAPLIWGSALARRSRPSDPAIEKLGRMSAGLVQLGMVFLFVEEMFISKFGTAYGASGGGLAPLFLLLRAAERILLLWSSVECMRTAPDEETLFRRLDRIRLLMRIWLILYPFAAMTYTVQSMLQTGFKLDDHFAHSVWSIVVMLTLTLEIALLVARRYRAEGGSYNSAPASHSSGGAET